MGPRTFWNVDYGTRNRAGHVWRMGSAVERAVAQPDGRARHETVKTDTGPVQGYNAQPIWASDAAAFNAA
jgi:hypothetical protein